MQGALRRSTRGIVSVRRGKVYVNETRIEELRSWFGVSVFLTDVGWSSERVVSRYGMLRRIESRWRDLKSGLSVRPVYHWTERSIRGHFVLKFIALYASAYMEHKLREAGIEMSWQEARDRLMEVKAVQMKFTDGKLGWVRSAISDTETLKVMRVLGVPTERVMLWMGGGEEATKS